MGQEASSRSIRLRDGDRIGNRVWPAATAGASLGRPADERARRGPLPASSRARRDDPKQPLHTRGAVWIDGEWTWRTRRWAWKPGRWVKPPPNARFAPWTTVRNRTGTLYFASGAWRDLTGAEVEEPEPLASAGPLPAVVVTPEGEEVKRTPIAPLDGGSNDASIDASPVEAGTSDAELDGSTSHTDAAAPTL